MVVETFSVVTILECGLRCIGRFQECKSFNYRQSRKFVDTFCDINNATKRALPEKSLSEEAESTYGEIVAPNFEVKFYFQLICIWTSIYMDYYIYGLL